MPCPRYCLQIILYYILVTGTHAQSAIIGTTDNLMSTLSYSTCCPIPQSKYWIIKSMYVSLAILHALHWHILQCIYKIVGYRHWVGRCRFWQWCVYALIIMLSAGLPILAYNNLILHVAMLWSAYCCVAFLIVCVQCQPVYSLIMTHFYISQISFRNLLWRLVSVLFMHKNCSTLLVLPMHPWLVIAWAATCSIKMASIAW